MQDLSSFYHFAREFALQTNRNIFLTGKAGTGKTTFLHNLRKETKKQMAIVAPTGVAAINAGGTTIHSFFQLPFTPLIPTVEGRKELMEKIKMQSFRRKVIQELELLIIDEISMVRADVLDAVDTVLRHIRYRFNEPFGGVQVIFIGDMFQLSPVAVEEEWRFLAPYYRSPYFFHSQVIAGKHPVYIELDKIFRQTDADFIKVLNEVRNNKLSAEGQSLLQSRYQPLFQPSDDDTYITLTTHNYKADKINAEELGKLKEKARTFDAQITGDFPEKSYPTDKNLVLKVGAKVMFIRNDNETPRRFFNGKIGIIQSFEEKSIIISCPEDNEVIELSPVMWENIRYTTNDTTRQIKEDVLGTFVQFPLRLAWAITIHKSQGLTFDKAIIDAGDAFAPGQVYVALSRCRNLQGMVLRSKINPFSIENDRLIVEHQQNKISEQELEIQLNESRKEFRLFILQQLFDFKTGIGHISRLMRDVEGVAGSFNEETLPFLKEILKQLQQLQDVAGKFQSQLGRLLQEYPVNEDHLSERIDAANRFFKDKTQLLKETLLQSPAITDSRENARDYTDQLKNLYVYVAQKYHVFNGLKGSFDTEMFFILKNTFLLPDFNVTAYAKTGNTKTTASRHPKLYFQLLSLRNKLCEPDDTPIYLVAGSKTLVEMADYLPTTEKDLLKIYGFGPAKVEKYGKQFIDIIQQYCSDNKLTTNMFEMVETKRERKEPTEKKEKKEKGDSHRMSYEMFKAGKSIDEIAAERGLTGGTVCGHLGKFIGLGQLSIDQFISPEKRAKAMKFMEENPVEGSVYQSLQTVLNKHEVNFFLSWMRAGKKE